jgi:AcrR family transcriptional regulator
MEKIDKRKLQGQDSRETILAVALNLFISKGYDATSIDDLRTSAGFRSKASLYTHFKNKEDVSEALMSRILAELEQTVFNACEKANEEPLAQFLACFTAYIEWGISHRQEYTFRFLRSQQERMLTGKYDYQNNRPSKIYPKMLNIIQKLRSHYPVRPITDEALASMTMGLISRAVIDLESFGNLSLKEKVDRILDLCMGIVFSEAIDKKK